MPLGQQPAYTSHLAGRDSWHRHMEPLPEKEVLDKLNSDIKNLRYEAVA